MPQAYISTESPLQTELQHNGTAYKFDYTKTCGLTMVN